MFLTDLKSLIRRHLRDWLDGAKPGPLYVIVLEQRTTKVGGKLVKFFKRRALFPPMSGSDVVTRELLLGGTGVVASEVLVSSPAGALGVDYWDKEGASVSLSLIDIDGAGNRSPASLKTYTSADDVPPGQPGELSIQPITQQDSDTEPSEPPATVNP
jgi:hypothetical protein